MVEVKDSEVGANEARGGGTRRLSGDGGGGGDDRGDVEPRLDTLTLVSIDTWTLLDTFGHYRHVRH
jgi:hypothetical protein